MSILKRLSRAEIESVYAAANSAIWYAHSDAVHRAGPSPREEDYVATLVTVAVPQLANRWDALLARKGIALRVSGVFCHGHPQVEFGTPSCRVELADLLIVHQHRARRKTGARALLVQAKMSRDGTHRLQHNDNQLRLYRTWPKFEIVTGGLQAGLRDLREFGKGSRYALIHADKAYPENITWAEQCPWATCPASESLSAEQSFARTLGNILLGKDGRTARLYAPRDDWSHTIKELLELTGKNTFTRTSINVKNHPRLTTAPASSGLMLFAQSSSFDVGRFADQPDRSLVGRFFCSVQVASVHENFDTPTRPEWRDGDGGISALLIETWEVER